MIVALVSGRYGVIWIIHDRQTWAELDVGAILVGWVSNSSAFAPSGIELLRHNDWNWSGWVPRIQWSVSGGIVSIPIWLLAMPLLALTFQRMVRRAQHLQFQCKSCDYDLTGNISGICPECGTAIGGYSAAPAEVS